MGAGGLGGRGLGRWAGYGAGGRGLGLGRGWGAGVRRAGRGLGDEGGGWGLTGGKNFSTARHIRVYTKHVHVLQLLHELFHLLLAVRAEAACATASASSYASRSGSSNTRRAGATAAARLGKPK